MRFVSTLSVCAFLILASESRADSHVFIVANQPDGYGVDECLAKGERCGAPAARAYCQAREFTQAASYRRVDPHDVTGTVAAEDIEPRDSAEYIAITCIR